ncbi:MAG TPA: hypothetical protein DIW41_00625 [Lachnospiraceae bacterium]|jgi:hypothetical protein|nr:hypothetical protein [Lachnospiraceae bacterium]
MKAIAKITSHMEDDPSDIWLRKSKIYELEELEEFYRFIDEAKDEHRISKSAFDKYFKRFQEGKEAKEK